MNAALNLLALAQAAIKFSQAAAAVIHHQQALNDAYYAWRSANSKWGIHITRDDENWNAMMVSTAEEYRQLQNAKGRERRAKAKLLALAGAVEVQ